MPDIEVYGVTAEAPLVASGFPTLRVRGVAAEVVRISSHSDQTRIIAASTEAILYKRPPASWLPRYIFDGSYWIPLFPVAGTPNAGIGLRDDPPFVFRSPDGTQWSLKVGNDGALETEALFEDLLTVVDVAYGSLSMSSSGEQTIQRPSSMEGGDLLVAQVVHRSGTGESTPPSNSTWTLLRRDKNPATVSGTDQWQEIWTRIATDNEPNTYTWRFGGVMGAAITVVRNPAGAVAIEDSAHRATSSGDHSAPSVTSQGEDRLLLKFSHCIYAGGNSMGGWQSSQLSEQSYGGGNNDRVVSRHGPVTETGETGLNYWQHILYYIIPGSDHDGGTTSVLLRAE